MGLSRVHPAWFEGIRQWRPSERVSRRRDFAWSIAGIQENRHLRYSLRLSRLTLIVAVSYVWLAALGAQVIEHGQRCPDDLAERGNLSIFRAGLSMVEWLLADGLPFVLRLARFFC